MAYTARDRHLYNAVCDGPYNKLQLKKTSDPSQTRHRTPHRVSQRRRPTRGEIATVPPPDTTREPCPDRILDDIGGAFGMGAVGGAAFHFVRGLYNSPNGHRIAGGATAARMNAGRFGGRFAVWCGLFSVVDCGMVYARQREDPWNSIAAGGLLSMRQGLLATGKSALSGGVLLLFIEGVGIMVNRVIANAPPPEDLLQFPGKDTIHPAPRFLGVPPAPLIAVQELPVPESGPTGWFGGFFGKKNDQVAGSGRNRKSEMLELDLPTTAVPSFDHK